MHYIVIEDIHDKYIFSIFNSTKTILNTTLQKNTFITDMLSLMSENKINLQNIDYIAICTDSTSYTGTRILYSFCIGLSLATHTRIINIDSDDLEKPTNDLTDSVKDMIINKINKEDFVDINNLHIEYK